MTTTTTAPRTPAKDSLAAVRETERLAATGAERHAARLWRAWAYWHRRWVATPTPTLDRREANAWAALRAHLEESMLEHTAFDPAD